MEAHEFAKSIPSFSDLFLRPGDPAQYGVHEAIFAMLASIVSRTGCWWPTAPALSPGEFLRSLRKPAVTSLSPSSRFAVKFNALELDDSDLALFIAAIILCGGKAGVGTGQGSGPQSPPPGRALTAGAQPKLWQREEGAL